MYGQLPSHIRAHATTYDLMVANTLALYEKRVAAGETADQAVPEMSQSQLAEILRQVHA